MTRGTGAIRGFHLVRYGTAADQKYLLRPFLGTYDQIVINANMVAHMPGALASFLMQRARNKPYFIDPQTHAFQHDIGHLESTSRKSAGNIKKSIKTLINAYGEPVKTVIADERRSILPADFRNKRIFKEYCKRVINFQLSGISREASQSDSAKYYSYLKEKGKIEQVQFEPTVTLAPYFYMTSNTYSEWIDLNIQAVTYSKECAGDLDVAAQIVISKDLLTDSELRGKLIKAYKDVAPSVFLVWIDALSEQRVNDHELKAFIELINGLGGYAPIVNLYGGFFSIALKRCKIANSLVGVCHGLEYGEHRGVLPVGGGVPMAKFYHPVMHNRLKFREAYRAIKREGGMRSVNDFHQLICDCAVCKAVIKHDPDTDFAVFGRSRPVSFIRKNQPIAIEYPLPETKDHCVKHYMWCKKREYGRSVSITSIMDDLARAEKLKGTLGLEDIAYITVWKKMLSQRRAGN